MIQANKPAVGETRGYLTLGDVHYVRGMAAHSRACNLVWRAGAYEVIVGELLIARRPNRESGEAAQNEYIARGYVRSV